MMIHYHQRQFYKELDGKMNGQTEAPDPKGSTESEQVEHNRDSERLKKVKEKLP